MAALFVPALVLLTGFLLPSVGPDRAFELLHQALASLPAKLVVLAVISLSFFHCAHRIRHTSMDLGLRSAATALALVCYGGALAASAASAVALFGIS